MLQDASAAALVAAALVAAACPQVLLLPHDLYGWLEDLMALPKLWRLAMPGCGASDGAAVAPTPWLRHCLRRWGESVMVRMQRASSPQSSINLRVRLLRPWQCLQRAGTGKQDSFRNLVWQHAQHLWRTPTNHPSSPVQQGAWVAVVVVVEILFCIADKTGNGAQYNDGDKVTAESQGYNKQASTKERKTQKTQTAK